MSRVRKSQSLIFGMLLAALVLCASVASAQSIQIQGVINGRSGATMTVQSDTGNVVVLLTPDTQVQEVQGVVSRQEETVGLDRAGARDSRYR